jgi:F-type H+-transporting ATPase subunit epsilon
MMHLKVLPPSEVLLDERVGKVTAEAQNGAFCLLPRHIDFVAVLVPGIFSCETADGEELFLAVDHGVLVKCGHEVTVSTRNAVRGLGLGGLRKTVEERFESLDEREKTVRSAMAKIQAGFVRRFLEIQGHE